MRTVSEAVKRWGARRLWDGYHQYGMTFDPACITIEMLDLERPGCSCSRQPVLQITTTEQFVGWRWGVPSVEIPMTEFDLASVIAEVVDAADGALVP